ncbi:hypothetical protein [Actinophytocola algeriensis]|uniref:Uncharacterized protein n=1 Tax=Actinophytocola algeriensis TaxID=1768010 RepID=A0A7W7QFT4_9PSEU|nr:hypothetical protein [Actinophytocola algeriensis]MBB4912846.1 hypothetical protein [Actinophytocola algeriensis]MBE1474120.1 hypothetical protein [Actinophytocola algeriensis]
MDSGTANPPRPDDLLPGGGGAELVAVTPVGLVGELQRMAVLAVGELSRHQEPEAHVVAKGATLHYAFYAAQ